MNTTAFGNARMDELIQRARRTGEERRRLSSVDANSTGHHLRRAKHRWTNSPGTAVARVAHGSMTDRGQIR